MNAMIICGVAAMLRSLKQTATSLSAIIRYDNMRRCRNVAFIEADCDKLVCYNFAMIICGVAVILVFMKRTAVSLSAIYIFDNLGSTKR